MKRSQYPTLRGRLARLTLGDVVRVPHLSLIGHPNIRLIVSLPQVQFAGRTIGAARHATTRVRVEPSRVIDRTGGLRPFLSN